MKIERDRTRLASFSLRNINVAPACVACNINSNNDNNNNVIIIISGYRLLEEDI